jgi:hypothetical protein
MKGNGNQAAEKAPVSRIQRGLEDRAGWWDALLDRPVLWAVIAIIGCTWLMLPKAGIGPPDWQPGDVASFDLVIPYDSTLPDAAATEFLTTPPCRTRPRPRPLVRKPVPR